MERPRTHAEIVWVPRLSSPVLSGSTRTIVPSTTASRTGQRLPQLTLHALQTIFSRPTEGPDATAAGLSERSPQLPAPATLAAPPAIAVQRKTLRRETSCRTAA